MHKSSRKIKFLSPIALALVVSGCAGTQPFNHAARPGDTVAIFSGWKHQFGKDQLTVTISPEVGEDIVYQPNDSRVRASLNLYPDPLSYMSVGYETNQGSAVYEGEIPDLTADTTYQNGRIYGQVVTYGFTNQDPDWWQSVVFVDMPDTLPVGNADVTITSSGDLGESWTVPVEIIEGVGSPHKFSAQNLGPMNNEQRHALERTPHFEVHFTGAEVPHAIQVSLSRDTHLNGIPYVVNPRGDIKNITWADDGENIRVMLSLTHQSPAHKSMERFKFYVTGGVSDIQIIDVQAFDVNGDVVPDVAAVVVDRS